jgi:hypothetical protein
MPLMVQLKAVAFAATLALPTAAMAGDDLPRPKSTVSQPKAALDYKLDLNTGLAPSNAPTPPAGTLPLTRETTRPFLGLKLTKPLGD